MNPKGIKGTVGLLKRADGGGALSVCGVRHSSSTTVGAKAEGGPGWESQVGRTRRRGGAGPALASWHHIVPTPTLGGPPIPLSPSVQVKDWKLKSSVTSAASKGQSWAGNQVPPIGKPKAGLAPVQPQQKATRARYLQIQNEVFRTCLAPALLAWK